MIPSQELQDSIMAYYRHNIEQGLELIRLLAEANASSQRLDTGSLVYNVTGTLSESELNDSQATPVEIVPGEDGYTLFPYAGFFDCRGVTADFDFGGSGVGFFVEDPSTGWVPFNTSQSLTIQGLANQFQTVAPIVMMRNGAAGINVLIKPNEPICFSYIYDGVTTPAGTGSVNYYLSYLKFPNV